MNSNVKNKRKCNNIMINGYPVRCEWRPDGNVVYLCTSDGCAFEAGFSSDDRDVEGRLDAYVNMHDHIKAHIENR